MSTLSRVNGWTIRKDDAVTCTCLPANPRHTSGTQCLSRAEVDAFKAAHSLKNTAHARALMFLETFNPLHPQDGRHE